MADLTAFEKQALALTKAKLGISSAVRDPFITSVIQGIEHELKDQQGLEGEPDSPCWLMFVVDLAAWRYENRDVGMSMPRNLQFRLHNMMLGKG